MACLPVCFLVFTQSALQTVTSSQRWNVLGAVAVSWNNKGIIAGLLWLSALGTCEMPIACFCTQPGPPASRTYNLVMPALSRQIWSSGPTRTASHCKLPGGHRNFSPGIHTMNQCPPLGQELPTSQGSAQSGCQARRQVQQYFFTAWAGRSRSSCPSVSAEDWLPGPREYQNPWTCSPLLEDGVGFAKNLPQSSQIL